jgi:hypothetical protein
MRLPFALAALLLPLAVAAAPPAKPPAKPGKVQRVERGSLVLENVPDIPPALAERTNLYQQARSASLQGWVGGRLRSFSRPRGSRWKPALTGSRA